MTVSITFAFKNQDELVYWDQCIESLVSNFENRVLELEPEYYTFRLIGVTYAEAIALFGIFLTADRRILFVIS
jgi:hypothetical protein